VLLRVAVDLGGGCQKKSRPTVSGKFKDVAGADRVRHQGLERMASEINRAGGAGKVIDPVDQPNHLQEVRLAGYIGFDDLQPRRRDVVSEILRTAGEEVVEDDDLVTAGDQRVDEVTADHPSPTGDQYPHRQPLTFRSDAAGFEFRAELPG
jgi:hypothetical protein